MPTVSQQVIENIGERLEELERSIAWLARQIGMEPHKLRRRMKGEVQFTADEVTAIARALGMSREELMSRPSASVGSRR